jgi:hypothetical protein
VLAAAPTPKPPRHPTTRPGDKRLTPKTRAAAPETNSDRHAPTPRRSATAKRTTNLAGKLPHHPNRCEFATRHATFTPPTRFNHQPTPPIAHDTRPSRPESTQPAPPTKPATGERKPNRLRKLFPPQAPASVPTRRSTSKVPNRPGQHLDIGPVGTWSPTSHFSRCGSLCQPPLCKVRFDLPTENSH